MSDLFEEMIQMDRESRSGIFAAWNKQPDELAPADLERALQVAFELAQSRATAEIAPQGRNMYSETPMRFGFTAVADVRRTPLPLELQTWERAIHDTMHHIILDSHTPLLYHQ